MGYQEEYFSSVGGDRYFERNINRQHLPFEVPGLSEKIRMWAAGRSETGSLCVFGGASGVEAAYFSSVLENWKVVNVDISHAAIENGRKVFPELTHLVASLTEKNLVAKTGEFDCVVLAGILCWVDRSLLSRAIVNIDELVKPGGCLGIYDFMPPFPRKNALVHAENVYTFKQDYSKLFEELGVFRVISKSFSPNLDHSYPFEDQLVGFSLLEKFSA